MIRHWAAAFEDANPVYVDADAAAASRFGEIVAPPLMLQTWTMQTPKITGLRERGGSPVEGERRRGAAPARRAPATSGRSPPTPSSRSLRYLRVGDTVSAETLVESVSPEKQTRLGPGRFLTWVTTYRDGAGEIVGTQTFRILKFKPEGLG